MVSDFSGEFWMIFYEWLFVSHAMSDFWTSFLVTFCKELYGRLRHYQKNHGERRPQNKGFGGRMVSIFVNFRPMTFKKKSEILECDPDVDKKIHGHRIFYAYTIFLHRKKVFLFFWHKSRSLYITLWST